MGELQPFKKAVRTTSFQHQEFHSESGQALKTSVYHLVTPPSTTISDPVQ